MVVEVLLWLVAAALFLLSGVRWLLLPLGISWPAWIGFSLGGLVGAGLTAGNLPASLAVGFVLAAVALLANGYRRAAPHDLRASPVHHRSAVQLRQAPQAKDSPRSVLIIVAGWPSGTMAMKLGRALQDALKVDQMHLVQMSPERMFTAVTNVTEYDFRASLAASGVSVPKQLSFVELGPAPP